MRREYFTIYSIITIILIIALSAAQAAFAQTVGNLIEPMGLKGPGAARLNHEEYGYIEINYNADFTLNKDLAGEDPGGSVDIELEGRWHMVSVSYAIAEKFQPYLSFGIAKLTAKWEENKSEVELESENGTAYGAGIKIRLWDFEDYGIKLTGSAGVRQADLDVGSFKVAKVKQQGLSNGRFEMREWFGALCLSKGFEITESGNIKVTPYIGAKYSDSNGRLRTATNLGTYNPGFENNKYNLGLVAGCDMHIRQALSLNAEAQFIDETSLSFGATALF